MRSSTWSRRMLRNREPRVEDVSAAAETVAATTITTRVAAIVAAVAVDVADAATTTSLEAVVADTTRATAAVVAAVCAVVAGVPAHREKKLQQIARKECQFRLFFFPPHTCTKNLAIQKNKQNRDVASFLLESPFIRAILSRSPDWSCGI